MKSSYLLFLAVLCLLIACSASASSPPWTGSGTYTFDDTDPYFSEGSIWDTATVDISGGSFGELGGYNYSTINMFDGVAQSGIGVRDNSTLNLYGGSIDSLGIEFDSVETATLNMFVDSYVFDPDSYLGYDRITGTWMNDNGSFDIIFLEGQFQYFNIVPEPTTILFFATGCLLLRRKK